MSEGAWDLGPQAFPANAGPGLLAADSRLTLPVSLGFSKQCRAVGFLNAGAAAFLLAVGLFLLSQVGSTPSVAVQLCAVGMLLTGAGLGFAHQAARRLLGALAFDRGGVTLLPTYAGFDIPWSRLSRWEVRGPSFPITGLPMVRLWAEENPAEFSVPAEALTAHDLMNVRQILRAYAPDRERRSDPFITRAAADRWGDLSA